jgi:hypothetical protein
MLMKKTGLILSLLGASMFGAIATAVPAAADTKPCCYNDGEYFHSSNKTCTRYGGRVVSQRFCDGRGYYRNSYPGDYRSNGPSFAIQIGDIVFAYSDGYYDRHRRWHRWRNDAERDYYRRHYSGRYYGYSRDRDRDQRRRDWWEGRRDRWD